MRILYVIDERGLTGGAHIATELLISALRERDYTVDVMEAIRRNSFWGKIQRGYLRILSFLPKRISNRLNHHPSFLRDPFGFKFRRMKQYDTVCVMSENSSLSLIVSRLPSSVRKVQMIHIDYPIWAKQVHRDIMKDGEMFKKFDCIACVGVINAKHFEETFPMLEGKIVPFHNIIKYSGGDQENTPQTPHNPIRLISLARINDISQKDGPRMIRIAKRLCDLGVNFVWDTYGGSGIGFKECQQEILRLGLENIFRIHSYDPEARYKIASSDLFVLLSHYEGLPNVIYEALLSGTPVFSTNVGGIGEQIEDGVNGWLVKDDEDAIVNRLATLLYDTTSIRRAKCAAAEFVYDNDKIVAEHIHFLSQRS